MIQSFARILAMFAPMKSYEVCLGNWEAVIPQICELIGLSDATDNYLATASAFEDSNNSLQEWSVQGSTGCSLSVTLEQYESYLFGKLTGRGSAFSLAAKLLWNAYIAQGGNRDAQRQPQ